jgi:phage N-6-adenine-methyltransferase
MINSGLMSSNSDMWGTPRWLFDALNVHYQFSLDVCALPENAKCKTFFSPEQDGLRQKWEGVCWMNPPYGREIVKWVKKAYESSLDGTIVVSLLPARTDTAWFWDYVFEKTFIEFIRGRLKFGDGKGSAPFPSMIAVWDTPADYNTLMRYEFSCRDIRGHHAGS